MDIHSKRVEMITGKSIEEATERLNSFLELCEVQRVEVEAQDIEYYPQSDRASEDRHGYLVRYDRYSEPEKEAYLHARMVNRIAEAWKKNK